MRKSKHCLTRMAQRGITDADIAAALADRIDHVETPQSSTRIRGYGRPGRVLKIWVPLDDPGFVKSVAWEDE